MVGIGGGMITNPILLGMGLDPKAAEYFAAGRHRIVAVEPNEDFTLTLVIFFRKMTIGSTRTR